MLRNYNIISKSFAGTSRRCITRRRRRRSVHRYWAHSQVVVYNKSYYIVRNAHKSYKKKKSSTYNIRIRLKKTAHTARRKYSAVVLQHVFIFISKIIFSVHTRRHNKEICYEKRAIKFLSLSLSLIKNTRYYNSFLLLLRYALRSDRFFFIDYRKRFVL